MNLLDLRTNQAIFANEIGEILSQRTVLYKKREKFVNDFSLERINTMNIDDYVSGNKNKKGFCYRLEYDLNELGTIKGSTAIKFGIYYGKQKPDKDLAYRYSAKFGNSPEEAFSRIKESLIDLLESGAKKDLQALCDNPISPIVKGKILSVYYPELYLNIFSAEHLDHYLLYLDLDNRETPNDDSVYKRERLIEFRNSDEIFKNWSLDLYATFLYHQFPKPPRKNKDINPTLKEYLPPIFPIDQAASILQLKLVPKNNISEKENQNRMPPKIFKKDYLSEARKCQLLGDRGEKIVLDYEVKKLNIANRPDLAAKVKRVSLVSDSHGYDILSYSDDGTEMHIEVKATTVTNPEDAIMYLTKNELKTAENDKYYYLYIVFDIKSKTPRISPIENPFSFVNRGLYLEPVKYRVYINVD